MSDYLYPPSEHRLAQLRLSGIMPMSRDALSLALILALVGAVLLLFQSELGALIGRCFSGQFSVEEIGAGDILPLFYPILLGLFSICVAGVVLSRGYFGYSRARADKVVRHFDVVRAILIFAVIVSGLWQMLPGYAANAAAYPAVGMDGVELVAQLQKFVLAGLGRIFLRVAALLFVFALIDVVYGWLSFRKRYSMTREEIEAESREMEARPEMRQAILDRNR